MEDDSNSTHHIDTIIIDDSCSENSNSSEKKNDDPLINFDSDSASSEDLPVLSSPCFDIGKLKQNDIVWAEYKQTYWPAIVRYIDKKNRKVSVWYCDSPGRSFKVPFQKVHYFNDTEFKRSVVDSQELSPELKQEHTKFLSLALAFSHRRAIGENDNPVLFFDTSKPYFTLLNNQNFSSVDKTGQHSQRELEQSDSKISSTKANEAGPSTEKEGINKMSEEFEDIYTITSSDGESFNDKDPKLVKFNTDLEDRSDECDKKTADAIISCIKSGHVDQYLLDIQQGKIKSRNQDIFNQAKKVRRKDILWNCTPTVNIGDFEKRRDVACYLKELYDRTVKKKRGFVWGEIDYVGTVWLCEAIDKAFSLITSEPSKFCLASNVTNCPSQEDEKHLSFAKDYDDQNGKKTKIESPVSSADKPEGKMICRINSQKKANLNEATRTKRKLHLRNNVSTSRTLKSSKYLDNLDSDVDSNDSAKYQRRCNPRRKSTKK